MAIEKGDKVRSSPHGPMMEVLAASQTWAICEWVSGGARIADLFEIGKLQKVAAQQAQQPQPPTDEPG
ncbi:MAG TPA: hypothetical protein VMZ74_11985 [Ramlibacter sp.]|nr:hypothetical protein [Ramlibacter sp.]